MKFVISSGHGLKVRGAAGSPIPPYLDEVDQARRVVEQVATVLRGDGHTVTTFHDDVSTSQNENLNRIVNFHNSKTRDWDVSVHFNAYETTSKPMGSEVLYVSSTGETMARAVVNKICENGFINRGPKKRTDLAFLNGTDEPAVLIETCFCDSKADCYLYNAKFNQVCLSIAEGLVGHDIGEEGTEPTPPEPTVPDPLEVAIADIAAKSEIASYNWRDRGVAPPGYIKGFALAWAQVLLRHTESAIVDMAKANTHDNDHDALAWYDNEFKELGMSNEYSGTSTLRHLFALMLGAGMRESSGKHCCGRDQGASNMTAETAEAGLYQTSYNARSASPDFEPLMRAYQAGEHSGYRNYFSEGVECSQKDWDCYGEGAGYEFQKLCKEQPAFAVETCALTLRNLRQHYGPINRKEVELREEADWMLLDVQRYLEAQEEAIA